jgi:hypothetical protein
MKKKIIDFMIENDIELQDILEAVIEHNGIIGVGLVSLGDGIQNYLTNRIKNQGISYERFMSE